MESCPPTPAPPAKKRRVHIVHSSTPPHQQRSKLPIYGNYPSYYTKRSMCTARLSHLDAQYFHKKRVLDIGCNSGHVTIHIAMHHAPSSIVGVDMDPALIQKAHSQVQFMYSLAVPMDPLAHDMEQLALSKCRSNDEFPKCFPSLYGHVPFPLEPLAVFPFNIAFHVQDIMIHNRTDHVQQELYDTILCLSVTKWIHLHHGDKGIKRLFARMHDQLVHGGILILEPQEWKGYAKKSKWTPHMRQVYQDIQFQPMAFDAHLQSIGFHLLRHHASSDDAFGRPLYVYQKQ